MATLTASPRATTAARARLLRELREIKPEVWYRGLAVYGVLSTGLLQRSTADLMALTGLPGNVIIGLAMLPLVVGALRGSLAALRSRTVLPTLALLGSLALSIAWSDERLDALLKVYAASTSLVWLLLFLAYPALVRTVGEWSLRYVLLSAALAVSHGFNFFDWQANSFAMVAAFAPLVLDDEGRGDALQWRRVGGIAACLAMLVLSTFRTATIGAVIGLALLAPRRASVRAALLASLLACAALLAVSGGRSDPSYAAAPDRTDLVGRYASLQEDHGSHRTDIWGGVLGDASTGPAWLLYGHGAGDVDYYVAEVGPRFLAIEFRGRPALHSHNMYVEFFCAMGVPGAMITLWWALSLALRARWTRASGGLVAATMFLGVGNVPFYDVTGGSTMLLGLLFYAVERDVGRREP